MNDATDKLLRDLAEKLGTTIDHLWAVMVRGAIVEGWIALIFAILSLGGIVAAGFLLRSAFQEEEEPVGLAKGGIAAALLVALGVVFPINLYNAIFYLGSPEYAALKLLLRVD